MRWLAAVAVGLAIVASALACGEDSREVGAAAALDCAASVSEIEGGFGAEGPHQVSVSKMPNPREPALQVHTYLPIDVVPAPLVVFGHANGLGDPETYALFVRHVASRGYALVYSPYPDGDHGFQSRYDAVWSGVVAAVAARPDRFDTTRVGFVGHSYGAGALPHLARRAFVGSGWGTRAMFVMSMAPWYSFGLSSEQWSEFPEHLKLLVLLFADDVVNDSRIAIDQYDGFPIAEASKTWLVVRSDERGGCRLVADHSVPQSAGLGGRIDALDRHAVFRLFDALAAAVFEGDEVATGIALGDGTPQQIEMGQWFDRTPVTPLEWNDQPTPLAQASTYLFRQSDRAAWESYPADPTTPRRPTQDGSASVANGVRRAPSASPGDAEPAP